MTHMYTCTHISTRAHTRTHIYAYTHIYTCTHNIHTYIHAYLHTFPPPTTEAFRFFSLKRGRRHALGSKERSQKKPVFVSSGPAGVRSPWSHSSTPKM